VLRPIALLALIAGACGSVAVAQASSATAPTALPPTLVALEQKMEALQVNSERFSVITKGSVTVTDETNGKPVGPSRHVSLDRTSQGEASLQPDEGEILSGNPSRPRVISIGSSTYIYEPDIAKHDGHRPWIRLDVSHGSTTGEAPILPYHGESGEVKATGTGSYAGLINLLGTAVGPVAVSGPVTVQGQTATEFTAMVEPLALSGEIPAKELALLREHVPPTRLEVFITESGLPVRVVGSLTTSDITSAQTTEILAVNVPVDIKRPPARKTIGQAQLNRRERSRHGKGGSGGGGAIVFTGTL
jgi:hypothetical protein